MKKYKILVSALLVLVLVFSLCACSVSVPTVGENGNWWIDGVDTGVFAGGEEVGDVGSDGKKLEVTSTETVSNKNGVHVYKIILSDGSELEITAKSGIATDIASCTLVEEKSTDTSHVYKITFSNGFTGEFTITDGKDGKDGTVTVEDIKNYDIIKTQTMGAPAIMLHADTLGDGEYLRPMKVIGGAATPVKNTFINNKILTVHIGIEDLESGSVFIGHGETEYGASYIEITKNDIKFYTMGSTLSNYKTYSHRLDISEFIDVKIDASYGRANIELKTADSRFSAYLVENVSWQGRDGAPFVKVVGTSATDASLSWITNDAANRIYMVGDSYFSPSDKSRWPSYLIENGYENHFMIGHSGMASTRGIEQFKYALEFGTPQYAFWCMGMNNRDSGGVNPEWLAATEEFLAICEEKGIIPILSTIPSTPKINNSFKNSWVRSWAEANDGRYVDFNKAVVEDASTSSWYEGMLYSDEVHPTALGAQALYMQAVTDFPELILK